MDISYCCNVESVYKLVKVKMGCRRLLLLFKLLYGRLCVEKKGTKIKCKRGSIDFEWNRNRDFNICGEMLY